MPIALPMHKQRLVEILQSFPNASIAVIGDFFLDKYLIIDPNLSERSLETGLTAFQVIEKRSSPGAAGTVAANLCALGVGETICIGVIGSDGEGFELKTGLNRIGANYDGWLIEDKSRFTPCYTKPMVRENGRQRELERIDIKNRAELLPEIENEIIDKIYSISQKVNAIVIADQVQERNFGVINDRIRQVLIEIAQKKMPPVVFADSRCRIGEFKGIITKPNKFEAYYAVTGKGRADDLNAGDLRITIEQAEKYASRLYDITRAPVFLTAQEDGILLFNGATNRFPAIPVQGEIDPVGAGDSCAAAIAAALGVGASLVEAAALGNLAASITIKKIGETGTASPQELISKANEIEAL